LAQHSWLVFWHETAAELGRYAASWKSPLIDAIGVNNLIGRLSCTAHSINVSTAEHSSTVNSEASSYEMGKNLSWRSRSHTASTSPLNLVGLQIFDAILLLCLKEDRPQWYSSKVSHFNSRTFLPSSSMSHGSATSTKAWCCHWKDLTWTKSDHKTIKKSNMGEWGMMPRRAAEQDGPVPRCAGTSKWIQAPQARHTKTSSSKRRKT
jgi:hypothetical protein